MNELEDILKSTQNKRLRLITTDGVFSMDGYVAKLDIICDLANKYNVRSVPTTVIEENGIEIDRFVGATSKQAVLNRIS